MSVNWNEAKFCELLQELYTLAMGKLYAGGPFDKPRVGGRHRGPDILVTLFSYLAIIGEILVKGGHISIFPSGPANIKVLGLFLSSLAVYTLLCHLVANCDK